MIVSKEECMYFSSSFTCCIDLNVYDWLQSLAQHITVTYLL